tara:strand:- start:6017 stop:7219 length:1203 start_codon:yes stop_codon:yes gene_type:complete
LKILVVHRYYWPDKSPDSNIIQGICKFLAKQNHKVDVITSHSSFYNKKNLKKIYTSDNYKNIEVFRFPLSKETLSPYSRIINAIKIGFWIIVKSFRKNYDVIIVTTVPPILSGFCSAVVSKFINARVIYYCMDLNPEIGRLSGDFKNKFLYELLLRLDNWTCKKAKPVLVHSIDMLKTLRSRKDGKKYNIQMMNNFSPISSKKKIHIDLDIKINPKNLNIIYTGNLGRFQGLKTAIKAMGLLNHKKNIKLIVMGDGVEKKKLLELSIKLKANVKFLKNQPIEIAKKMIKKSDICLVSLIPKMYKFAYPSKIITYLEQGRPIILLAEKQSEMVRNMVSQGYGFSLTNGSEKNMADLFKKLAKNKNWKKKMVLSSYKAFKKNFSTNFNLKKWSNVVEKGNVE